jgi:5-methylcytosine-specific restriction endonuclease McrA
MSRTNRRITKKERGLIKGGIRRAFSRSELREKAIAASRVDHFDPERPRVKKWSYCADCGVLTPTYAGAIDHKDPIISTDSSFEDMSLDEVVDRTWCPEDRLQFLCESCHNTKTQDENKIRRENKKLKKEASNE